MVEMDFIIKPCGKFKNQKLGFFDRHIMQAGSFKFLKKNIRLGNAFNHWAYLILLNSPLKVFELAL